MQRKTSKEEQEQIERIELALMEDYLRRTGLSWWKRVDQRDEKAPGDAGPGLSTGTDRATKLETGIYENTHDHPGVQVDYNKEAGTAYPLPRPSYGLVSSTADFRKGYLACIDMLASQGVRTIKIEIGSEHGGITGTGWNTENMIKDLILLVEERGLKVSFGANVTNYIKHNLSAENRQIIFDKQQELVDKHTMKHAAWDGLEQNEIFKQQQTKLVGQQKLAAQLNMLPPVPPLAPATHFKDELLKKVLKEGTPAALQGDDRLSAIEKELTSIKTRLDQVNEIKEKLATHQESVAKALQNKYVDPTNIEKSREKSALSRPAMFTELAAELKDLEVRQAIWSAELTRLDRAVVPPAVADPKINELKVMANSLATANTASATDVQNRQAAEAALDLQVAQAKPQHANKTGIYAGVTEEVPTFNKRANL